MSFYKVEFLWHLLSEELITDILTRLPAKPLARFKCVSKGWNSLISHPRFLKSYISPSPSSTYVVLDRNSQLVHESTQYVTQFNLLDPPNVFTSSINPHKLAAKPVTQPFMDLTRSKYPTALLQSSNGLLLFTLLIERDPHKEHEKDPNSFSSELNEDSLYVVNPVTNEWAPLPKTRRTIMFRTRVAFTTKLDPVTGLVDKFMVVVYEGGIGGGEGARLICFSSDVGKWVEKKAIYMLGGHHWVSDWSFEFEGSLFWADVSTGLITWDAPENDPFVGFESEKTAVCRFIPLPSGRAKHSYTRNLEDKRCIGSGGGFINFVEVFNKGDYVFKLWRLNDCESGEWSLMYMVSPEDVERNLPSGFEKGMPKPCFVHPFKADVAYFKTRDYIFSLNVGTGKLESCVDFTGHKLVFPMVLPRWPSPIPNRLYAAYAKEQGNESFRLRNFTEAISCYSKSINLSPNAAAFANRAMSYLKVNKFHEAENDCTESLKLDANYFKVYWRRAQARKELGYLEGALEDAEFGLKLEPENEQVKKLCAELKSMIGKETCEGRELSQKGEACDKDVEGK